MANDGTQELSSEQADATIRSRTYAALVVVSFAATLALYDVAVRRFRPARLLLGMKPRRFAR